MRAEMDGQRQPGDPFLSPQGRAEAERAANYLQQRPIVRVYTSPLRRAQETAVPIAAALGLPVVVEPRLRERINFGDVPGQSFAEFQQWWAQCSRERDYVPPVGDSSRHAGARMAALMDMVYTELPQAEVVAVAHGGIIADFLLNICSPEELARLSPAFAANPYDGAVMRNGSITVVERTTVAGEAHYTVVAIALLP